MKKFLIIGLILTLLLILALSLDSKEADNIRWGVNFSQKQAAELDFDWRDVYLATLDDLMVKHIKVAGHWDLLESQDQSFSFEDLDWQMDQASQRDVSVILAIGMRTPRWPECHIPEWAKLLSEEDLQSEILEMLEETILRYKNHPALEAWQIENEALFHFGECPFRDASFLEEEIKLAKQLDPAHEVFTSDSGELSTWLRTASRADKLAITLYRKVWSEELNTFVSLPILPSFYANKTWIINQLLNKEVFVGELQAEPWVTDGLKNASTDELEKTLTLDQLQKNISFARRTGLDSFYLWGVEWWYYMKETRGRNEFWEEARGLFISEEVDLL
jgi:hypothetical protein